MFINTIRPLAVIYGLDFSVSLVQKEKEEKDVNEPLFQFYFLFYFFPADQAGGQLKESVFVLPVGLCFRLICRN